MMQLHKLHIGVVILLLWFISFTTTHAQTQNVFWVQFKTKSANLFLPAQSFLSEKAIERRNKNAVALTEGDYPVYKPYINEVAAIADSVIHTLKWFNAITIVVYDTTKLATIRALPSVKLVQQISLPVTTGKQFQDKFKSELNTISATGLSESDYGTAYNQTNMLRTNKIHTLGYTGKGVTIAVFDNGFVNVNQLDAYKHLFNEGRVQYTYDYVRRNNNVYTGGTHGSYVISTIAANEQGKFIGTAPDANFLLFTTEDTETETIMEELHWAEAAEKADSIGADIFSTSLGYIGFEDNNPIRTYNDMSGNSTIITQAANIAYSKGIMVVNSAGNEGAKDWRYIGAPADGNDVFAIGAVNAQREIASFSSRGPNSLGLLKPDVCAQGADVAVLDAGGFASKSAGTSFSCPIMSGSIACLMQALPDKKVNEIKQLVIESAHLFSNPDNNYGYGIPDFYSIYVKEKYPQFAASKENMWVFPNPLQASSSLYLRTPTAGNVKVELADISGKKVHSINLSLPEDFIEIIPLNFTDLLSAGKYFLRITTPAEKKTIKLVKTDE